jgi:hypothetical protein
VRDALDSLESTLPDGVTLDRIMLGPAVGLFAPLRNARRGSAKSGLFTPGWES